MTHPMGLEYVARMRKDKRCGYGNIAIWLAQLTTTAEVFSKILFQIVASVN
jgi:hypothetical protein